MKRFFCFTLTLMLLCGCALPAALAAEDVKTVRCDEQGFSTRIPSSLSAAWEEGAGLRISVGTPGYVPYVLVFRRPQKLNNPVNYLNNVYREYMENKYNNNVGTNPCKTYELGGKTLYGATYHYEANGNKLCLTLMIEVRDDGDVQYSAKYQEGKGDAAMAVLETAVRYYQPDGAEKTAAGDPAPAAAAADGLQDVRCSELGFATKMPTSASATMESDGIFYIWLGTEGYVPNVYIWRRTKKLNNPDNYVRKVYTDYMKETHGENLVGTTLYEYYEIGGKRLYGASYIYKAASGRSINQLFLVEVRDDGDVEYTARFLNSERESTLAALDAAVRYYRPDGAQTGKDTGKTAGKQLNAAPAKPIVSGTKQYKDKNNRFTMTLPENWQIMTQSEYMTFCFKAWDPSNPNRTIFLFMKLEPFLKSQAAREKYKMVDDSLGGNSLYALSAYAPVMESCTLKGLLDALPQTQDFCERFYDAGLTISPSIIPQMTNVKIVEKKASSLPAPAACKENVIGRITYRDYLGQPCEGLVTAQPLNTMSYDFFGVDGWPYTVYLFMGVTTPIGELQELEPVLTQCLSSFAFEQSYVKKAIDISNEETQTLLQQARTMQAAHDAMVDAWYAREKTYDIASQKQSDSMLGYDRLYDPDTGEVYRAEAGFYDSYNLNRNEYSKSNLQLVDSASQDYYLKSVDYYITK